MHSNVRFDIQNFFLHIPLSATGDFTLTKKIFMHTIERGNGKILKLNVNLIALYYDFFSFDIYIRF